MRNDLIELLALLVSVGYIKSFRVTKNYIYVTMKNDRQFLLVDEIFSASSF